jgi:hypothetical protein
MVRTETRAIAAASLTVRASGWEVMIGFTAASPQRDVWRRTALGRPKTLLGLSSRPYDEIDAVVTRAQVQTL